MRIGYNTNGLAHHSLAAAIELLASLGYRSVAITLDHAALDPFGDGVTREVEQTRQLLDHWEMHSVVETGARYLLDARRKHHPTFVSPAAADRSRRIEFLRRAIDIAEALDSDCVSLWSGTLEEGEARNEAWRRLLEGLQTVLEYADQKQVQLGFEPEPGMVVDTMTRFAEMDAELGDPKLGLTLDIGHLHCLGDVPIADSIHRWSDRLVNVHIEDMRAGVHEHLMFGEGEIDFAPVIAALKEIDYDGGLHVELSRHSHAGPAAAREAFHFLKPLVDAAHV